MTSSVSISKSKYQNVLEKVLRNIIYLVIIKALELLNGLEQTSWIQNTSHADRSVIEVTCSQIPNPSCDCVQGVQYGSLVPLFQQQGASPGSKDLSFPLV